MTQSPHFERFSLAGRVAVITGGAGLLGREHAAAIAETGGTPVLWDIDEARLTKTAAEIAANWSRPCLSRVVDITNPDEVAAGLRTVLAELGRCDILINNAAIDPKVNALGKTPFSRLEVFSLESWNKELAVGLTGSFLCAQVIGTHMAETGGGVILNISSDLGVIAPDQRLYRKDKLGDHEQAVKPVTYSVIKHGLIGLTKYLATYWADKGVRANALAPAGVYTDQPDAFVQKLTNLIPMGRMASRDEYRGAVQFLCSDASRYMNGSCVVMDGGRSVW